MKIISRQPSDFISRTEVWHVHSDRVGDRFRVCVTLPQGPAPDGQLIPAVYATDGDLNAGTCASLVRLMDLAGETPPFAGISIGYPLDHPINHILQRNRDLSSTHMPAFDPVLPKLFGGPVVKSGGADAFLAFLREELRPALEREYHLDPNDALLAGASLGGLFAVHAFARDPRGFRRYLAISPAVWWDNQEVIHRIRAMTRDETLDGGMFLCAGEFESKEHAAAQIASRPELAETLPDFMKTVDLFADIAETERAVRQAVGSGFSVTSAIMPRETHLSVALVAFSQGIRHLLGNLAINPETAAAEQRG